MLRIAQTLAQLAVLKQFEIIERAEYDFKAWLTYQDYLIDDEITSESFELRLFGDNYFRAIANDSDRFTRASVETIAAIQENRVFSKGSAWVIICSYYASFFAAHGILRIFGITLSQLSYEHTSKILDQAILLGKDAGLSKIEAGFYRSVFDKSSKTIEFKKLKDSHADLWATFFQLLKDLINDVPNLAAISQDKLDTMDFLIEIKNAISQKDGRDKGNWLSIIRNDINYQGFYGTWFPYSRTDFNVNLLSLNSKRLLEENLKLGSIIESSVSTTAINTSIRICNLLIHLVKTCNQKCNNRSYNFINGSLKMINILLSK